MTSPNTETVGLGALDGSVVAFKFAGVSHPQNILIASPPTGVTPALVRLALNPYVVPYLPSGTYTFTVKFSSEGACTPGCGGGTRVILRLDPAPPPVIIAITSAATLKAGPIAPGSIVSIFGANLGTPPIQAQFDTGGLFPTMLGNTTVTFNGLPAALLYVSTTQVNAVVPFALAGQKSAEVVLKHDRSTAPSVTVPLADTAPGVFTATQTGSGQGAIVNFDWAASTYNSADNPAAKGSIITFFAPGAGAWKSPFPEGSIFIGGPVLSQLAAPVTLTIGGQSARVQYAGAAPYQTLGMLQVNAVVPEGAASGAQPLVLTVGDNNNAQQQVTVAVR